MITITLPYCSTLFAGCLGGGCGGTFLSQETLAEEGVVSKAWGKFRHGKLSYYTPSFRDSCRMLHLCNAWQSMRGDLMIKHIRNRHLFISDIVLLVLASYLCFVVRFDTFFFQDYSLQGIILFTFLVVPISISIFSLTGIYRRYWQFASVEDMILLSGAVAITTLVLAVIIALSHMLQIQGTSSIPRSIPFVFLPLALLSIATPRIILRVMTQSLAHTSRPEKFFRVLVVGAGRAGVVIVREIQQNPRLGLYSVGFIDDDTSKQGVKILGVPVLGSREDIPMLVRRYDIDQVIIAMPSLPGKTIRSILDICDKAKVSTRTMPGIYELLDGKASVSQLRPVQIEDLLRRDPVQTDIDSVRDLIAGKCVLITGAGGSIGSELCRQVLRCQPAQMVLVGHGENSIFTIHNELKKINPGILLQPIIADLRFPQRLESVFQQYRPDIVFHAAAHKHVPLMESNPSEAITNNVLGTRNLLQVSLAMDVDHFVMISTDKAVNSANVMGASKRVAEMLVNQAAQRSGKSFVSVRFGNVLGSRGSVVLTFKEQLAAGGPITVTHPEMTRYFMTIPEAVQLVLQAAVLGKGGEVFVLDMGDPVKIVDLARDMIELSGLQEGRDIDIVYTGLRPGEKMYEELFVTGEQRLPTLHPKIQVVRSIAHNGNGNGQDAGVTETNDTHNHLDQGVEALITAASYDDDETIIHLLKEVNPLYCPLPQERQSVEAERQN